MVNPTKSYIKHVFSLAFEAAKTRLHMIVPWF